MTRCLICLLMLFLLQTRFALAEGQSRPSFATYNPERYESFCVKRRTMPRIGWLKKKIAIFPLGITKAAKMPKDHIEHIAKETRGVFQMVLPLRRYRSLMISTPNPVGKFVEKITLDDIKKNMNPTEFREVGCADFVVFPKIALYEAEVKPSQRQISNGSIQELMLWHINLGIKASFYRVKKGKLYLLDTAEAEVPQFEDLIADASATLPSPEEDQLVEEPPAKVQDQEEVGDDEDQKPKPPINMADILESYGHIESIPQDIIKRCNRALKRQRFTSLRACARGKTDPFNSQHIRAATRIWSLARCLKNPPKDQMKQLRCEMRNRSEQAARALRRQMSGIEAFEVYGPIRQIKGTLKTSIGRQDGVQMNHEFFLIERRPGFKTRHLGFVKIHKLGPGGLKGRKKPSHGTLIKGRYKSSKFLQIDEYSRYGIDAGVHMGMMPFQTRALTLPNQAQSRVSATNFTQGTAFNIHYDLGPMTEIRELYASGVYHQISHGPMSASLFGLGAERRWFLGKGWSTKVSGSLAMATLTFTHGLQDKIPDPNDPNNPDLGTPIIVDKESSTRTFGLVLGTGLRYRLYWWGSFEWQLGYHAFGAIDQFATTAGDQPLFDDQGSQARISLSGLSSTIGLVGHL